MTPGASPRALLDIREMGEYRRAHIPGCTPLPLGDLESRAHAYVPDPGLPVAVYGCCDGREEEAAAILRRLGFEDVQVLPGGLAAWTQEGREVATGWGFEGKQFGERIAVEQDIPHVTADDLAREAGKHDVLILDTRTAAEFEKGHLPGASWLPPFGSLLHAADLCRRHRRVYVNCAGRTRSILGTRLLRRMGFDNVFAVENGTWGWIHSGRKLEKGAGRSIPPAPETALAAAAAHAEQLARERRIPVMQAAAAHAWLASTRRRYVVDVRHAHAFRDGHVPDALHIEGGLLQFLAEERIAVRTLPVLVVGECTADAVAAAAQLADLGYDARVLAGGQGAWTAAKLPVAAGEQAWPDTTACEPLAGSVERIDWTQARPRLAGGSVLLDVRSLGEFALGHVPGSTSLPLGCLARDAASLARDRHYITAATGSKAVRAAARLLAAGLQASALRPSIDELPAQGVELVEGIDGARATLDEAKEDVDPFRRRGALRQTVAESHAYLEWESALAHGVAPPSAATNAQP